MIRPRTTVAFGSGFWVGLSSDALGHTGEGERDTSPERLGRFVVALESLGSRFGMTPAKSIYSRRICRFPAERVVDPGTVL